MRKKGIFASLFLTMLALSFFIILVYSLTLAPDYKRKLQQAIFSHGRSVATSTISACSEALFLNDFSIVIEFARGVLNTDNHLEFIQILPKGQAGIVVRESSWYMENANQPMLGTASDQPIQSLVHRHNPIVGRRLFVYRQPIEFSNIPWGTIAIGISDADYLIAVKSQYWHMLYLGLGLFLVSGICAYIFSRRITRPLISLKKAANQIGLGNFSVRASIDETDEIGTVAYSFNRMADSLQEKTDKLNLLANVVRSGQDAVIILDAKLNVIFLNKAFEEITGLIAADYIGRSSEKLRKKLGFPDTLRNKIICFMRDFGSRQWRSDVTILGEGAKEIPVDLLFGRILENSEVKYYFCEMTDISTRKKLEFELNRLAYFDKLTGLPNRRFFFDRLEQIMSRAIRENNSFALLFLDLDDFKVVNDSLGHDFGDLLLQETTNRLRGLLRKEDSVFRLGGDEFTFILQDFEHIDRVSAVAQKILNSLNKVFLVRNHRIHINASIGIAIYPNDCQNVEELVRNADTAMYSAKEKGKNRFHFFTQEMNDRIFMQLELVSELRAALKSDQLTLYFQPVVNAENDVVASVEALIRWRHPQRGLLNAVEFIPAAESSGLILPIGEWVLEKACCYAKVFADLGSPTRVSVNVSIRQFEEESFVQDLKKTITNVGVDPKLIALELTETHLMQHAERNIRCLNEIRAFGVRIYIDDFGTGYSSLSYLTKFPIDTLKIDKIFIEDFRDGSHSAAITSAIISLAKILKINVIAEGVETEAQLKWLKKHKCRFIQGYYTSAPLSEPEFLTYIETCSNRRGLERKQLAVVAN